MTGLFACLLAATLAARLSAQAPAAAVFTVLQRGLAVGTEEVTVTRTAAGTTIKSSGRIGPPVDLILRSLEINYDAGWTPIDLSIDATLRQQTALLTATVRDNVVTTELRQTGAQALVNRATVSAGTLLLVNPYVAPYEALAARLAAAQPGDEIPVHQPGGPVGLVRVGEATEERIQTLRGLVQAKRTRIESVTAGTPSFGLEVWSDAGGRLLRVSVPAQQIEFVREDIGSVSSRIVTTSRANDEDVRIPANGFSLAGTLSKPTSAPSPSGAPAVVLISGAAPTDRDESVAGIPLFGQLADAIAEAGFFVLRYDKRGAGQSGGRPDAATLTDFADDAKAAVKFLSDRKDIDRRRIAVVGHSEGGWVALLTAKGNNRVSAVGLLSTNGTTGADFNLYQVGRRYDRGNRPEAERNTAVELQRQIQTAVITGKGWEAIQLPPGTRAQADTPYFQSFLTLDPVKLLKDVDQPLLIVQGELDRQLPAASADTLATAAKARKNAAPVDVVRVPAVNHLLVPATTGEVEEYGTLTDRRIGAAVTSAVTGWLQKTLRAAR